MTTEGFNLQSAQKQCKSIIKVGLVHLTRALYFKFYKALL